MYGHDRLTQPMLRKTERQIRQERRVHAGLVGRGLRRDGREVQGRAEEARAERRRHVRLRPMDDLGRLRGRQAVQGRLPHQQHRSQCAPLHGVGRRRLHAHLRHRRADGLLRRHRGGRRVRAVGLEHGGDAPAPVDAGHRPAALARRMSASPCSRPSSTARSISPTSASCSSRRPTSSILNAIANHIIKTGRVNKDFVARHTVFKRGQTDIGYGLRPEHPLQKKATGAAKANDSTDMTFEEYAKFVSDYTMEKAAEMSGVPAEPHRGAGRALCRPEDQGRQLLDHGLQPAHPRRLVQQPRLQHPSADRKNLRARQQPVLAHRPAVGLRHRARGRHVLASPAGRHGGDQQGASRHRGEDLEAARRHHSRQARLSRGAAEPHAEGRQAQRLLGAGEQQPPGRRRTPTRRPIRAIATRTTSSSSRTPIRP